MASTLTAKQQKGLSALLSAKQAQPPRRTRNGRSRRQAKRENKAMSLAIPGSIGLRPMAPTAAPPAGYNLRIPYRWECLGAVTSPGSTFTVNSFLVNPGNTVTFPWLSVIAQQFEMYRFRSLRFCFVSTSADAVGSTNTALGSVITNTNYDVNDPVFSTQLAMEDYGGAAEGKPSEDTCHIVDCSGRRGSMGGLRYVLPGSGTTAGSAGYPTATSAHDYDLGLFQIATVGQQASSTLGRLYVHYEVDLIRAKTNTSITSSIVSGKIVGAGGGVSRTAPFGAVPTVSGNFPATAVSATLTFTQAVQALLIYEITGTTTTATMPTVTGTATAVVLNTAGQTVSSPGTTAAIGYYAVTASAGQTLIFDFTASATTVTGSTWRLAQYTASLGKSPLRSVEERLKAMELLLSGRARSLIADWEEDDSC